nr:hypothetical protein CFP56_54974 [Quercus suber]POF24052.1 hypothetical protein CFP56_54988 [Quercus suber]
MSSHVQQPTLSAIDYAKHTMQPYERRKRRPTPIVSEPHAGTGPGTHIYPRHGSAMSKANTRMVWVCHGDGQTQALYQAHQWHEWGDTREHTMTMQWGSHTIVIERGSHFMAMGRAKFCVRDCQRGARASAKFCCQRLPEMCPSQCEVLLPETARDVPEPERSSVASDCQRCARASNRAYAKFCVRDCQRCARARAKFRCQRLPEMCHSQSEVLLPAIARDVPEPLTGRMRNSVSETARDVPEPERSSVARDCQRCATARAKFCCQRLPEMCQSL